MTTKKLVKRKWVIISFNESDTLKNFTKNLEAGKKELGK